MKIFFNILYNLGMLVALSILSGFLGNLEKYRKVNPLFQGLLFGAGAMMGMIYPVELGPGLIFDGRSVLISLAGLYYGPAAGFTSALMAAGLRFYQGGVGAQTGIFVITAATLIGILFYFKKQEQEEEVGLKRLLLMGAAVHTAMLSLMFTLPGDLTYSTLKNIGLPVFFFYPLATLMIGMVINKEISRRKLLKALTNSEQQIRSISDNLKESMIYQVRIYNNGERKFTYLSDSVKKLYGITPEEGMANADLIYQKINPEDTLRLVQTEEEARKNLSIFRAEVQILTPSGEIRWSSLISSPTLMKDGSVLFNGIESVITDIKENQVRLQQSRTTLKQILDNMPQAVFWKNPEGIYLGCNPVFAHNAGFGFPEEVVGKTDFDLPWPEAEAKAYRADDQEVFQTCVPKLHILEPLQKGDGSRIWIDTSKVPLLDENEQPFAVLGIYTDITLQKQAEEQIKNALAEKETLLRELYHRTKNNMQVIISLLRLKENFTQSPELKTIVEEIILRIQAMSLVQQKLSRSGNLSRISLKDYFTDLTEIISHNYVAENKKITFDLNFEEISTLIDIATPCGLILNELITNSLKHAFKNRNRGNILIELSRPAEGTIRLVYQDDGEGLLENKDLRNSNSLGMLTIFSLAEHQLKGRVHYENQPGLRFVFVFRDQQYHERI